MGLEFNKMIDQVFKMGSLIEKLDFDMRDQLDIARERFFNANDLDFIQERVELVRRSDISGYRGAAPVDAEFAEPVNRGYAPPEHLLDQAILIAADGSQIYPNEQSPIHYYVLNTGLFIFHHGADKVPEQITNPKLYYHKAHLNDSENRLISNQTVDARRTVMEMQHLGEVSWEYRRKNPDLPIFAFYDNHLLFWANNDVVGGGDLMKDYEGALTHLYDSGAFLAGYIDNPHRGTVMLRLLYLLSLQDEADIKAHETILAKGGDLEGLRDRHLFNSVLRVGERSAIMVQNSPRNLAYKQRGINYEVAFFYVKVGTHSHHNLARVDVPMWVVRQDGAIDQLHAMILNQSRAQGRNPYPYVLTRADELARITGKDKNKLEEMISLELRKKGISPGIMAAKAKTKLMAHSDMRNYDMRTDL